MTTTRLSYASFGQRFAALLLDSLILLPLGALTAWLAYNYRLFQLYYLIPGLAVTFLYNVYLVKRCGATPGKLIMGIHIVKVDGSTIAWKQAILRYAVELVFVAISSIAYCIAVLQISDAEYHSLSWVERSNRIQKLLPFWNQPTMLLQAVWVWSEPIVMLSNRSRRALHDFIAGTVVIRGMKQLN